jgi:hypothetical protein
LFTNRILPETEWKARREAHQHRVSVWTRSHRERSSRKQKHPIYDFLFNYYAFRPGLLNRWHPGPEITLAGDAATEFLCWPEYRETANGVRLDATQLSPRRREFVAWLKNLLTAVARRPAFFGCFGLHEWAMVYKQLPGEVRHSGQSLRLSPQDIANVVEARGVLCTHYDAFRFFTPEARPLNGCQPTRKTTLSLEQRGCLHANMDLYKWAFKLAPFTASEFVADCFALAYEIREVDMRASPYDLSGLGFPAIRIEDAEGRAEYEQYQRAFAARSEDLRANLVAVCDWIERPEDLALDSSTE